MFDPSVIPQINSNVQAGLAAIGAKSSTTHHDQMVEAFVLLRFKVLKWSGDATLAHGAQNVLQQVNQGSGNMDRHNARDAAAALADGRLSIVLDQGGAL